MNAVTSAYANDPRVTALPDGTYEAVDNHSLAWIVRPSDDLWRAAPVGSDRPRGYFATPTEAFAWILGPPQTASDLEKLR